MKIKGYAKFGGERGGGGQIRCIMGDVQVAICFLKNLLVALAVVVVV